MYILILLGTWASLIYFTHSFFCTLNVYTHNDPIGDINIVMSFEHFYF